MAMVYLFLQKKKDVLKSTHLYKNSKAAKAAFLETFPAIFLHMSTNTIDTVRTPYKK